MTVRLTPDMILRAYSCGMFPMAEAGDAREVFWVDPDERGILPLEAFHVSRSLRKTLRRDLFDVGCDDDFVGVLDGCAAPKPGREGTWINGAIFQVFAELHRLGFAHSIECRQGGKLVGGLYGLSLGGAFFGESMFSRVADASKVALCHLVSRLRRGRHLLLDVQFLTAHLARFGAREIPRENYLDRLEKALKADSFWPRLTLSGADVVEDLAPAASQPMTQTS